MADLRPFRYEAGRGFLHGLHPLAKALALTLLSATAMSGGPLVLAAAGTLVLLGLASLRARPRELSGGLAFLAWIALFSSLLRLFSFSGGAPAFLPREIPALVLYLSRLVVLWLAGEAFFRSTSPSELGDSLSALCRRLAPGLKADPGIYIGLALDFIPRVFAAWEEAMDAAASRGLGGGFPRPAAFLDVLTAMLQRSMRQALRASEALEARSYRPDRSLFPPPFRLRDGVFCFLAAAFLLASLALRRVA